MYKWQVDSEGPNEDLDEISMEDTPTEEMVGAETQNLNNLRQTRFKHTPSLEVVMMDSLMEDLRVPRDITSLHITGSPLLGIEDNAHPIDISKIKESIEKRGIFTGGRSRKRPPGRWHARIPYQKIWLEVPTNKFRLDPEGSRAPWRFKHRAEDVWESRIPTLPEPTDKYVEWLDQEFRKKTRTTIQRHRKKQTRGK